MTNIKAYRNQDYQLLDEEYSSTRLFVDNEFPACLQSISHTGGLDLQTENGDNMLRFIEWRRPHEIVDEPHFVIDGFQRRDIGQGQLGNCWFVAAAGALTLNGELMAQVIPYDQMFDPSEYTGMFHFRFWLFGEWNDVVIDDRLPCYKGNFVFCRNNKDPNELWAPLLEKAYAKVCGSYELMAGGQITDGLIDFTGGLEESIVLNLASPVPDFKAEIKRLLYQAMERKSMVGCGIYRIAEVSAEESLTNKGLVPGHAFSVTQIKELPTPNGTVTLVRCLNPWNNSTEWNGDWSDNSPTWDTVAEVEKRKLKFHALHDGEFWMSYDDFFINFDVIQICHRRPESLGLLDVVPSATNAGELAWHEEMFHGKWKRGKSAGGSGLEEQPPEKYWINPQYLIKLEFTDDGTEEKWCTMIIALMFKEGRQRKLDGEDFLCIAFDVYKIKDNADMRTHIEKRQKFYMTDLDFVGDSGEHVGYRSVSKRFKVRPGAYIIIPNTLNYNEGGKYLLRIFTEKGADQTVTTKLKIKKKNLTESEIKRPHVKNNSKLVDTSDSSDDETNDDIKDKNTESEIKSPDVTIDNKVDTKVDIKLVSAPASSNEQTNNGTKDIGSAFPGSNPTTPSNNINVKNKEGYCTIQ